MKTAFTLVALLLGACSQTSPGEACVAAGGTCHVGPPNHCPNVGPQECGDPAVIDDPGGHYCCLSCPSGTTATDAGTCGDGR